MKPQVLNSKEDILFFGKFKGQKVKRVSGFWLKWAERVGAVILSEEVRQYANNWIEDLEEMKNWGANSIYNDPMGY